MKITSDTLKIILQGLLNNKDKDGEKLKNKSFEITDKSSLDPSKLHEMLKNLASAKGSYISIESPALEKVLIADVKKLLNTIKNNKSAPFIAPLMAALKLLYKTCPTANFSDSNLELEVTEYFADRIREIKSSNIDDYHAYLVEWELILRERPDIMPSDAAKSQFNRAWYHLAEKIDIDKGGIEAVADRMVFYRRAQAFYVEEKLEPTDSESNTQQELEVPAWTEHNSYEQPYGTQSYDGYQPSSDDYQEQIATWNSQQSYQGDTYSSYNASTFQHDGAAGADTYSNQSTATKAQLIMQNYDSFWNKNGELRQSNITAVATEIGMTPVSNSPIITNETQTIKVVSATNLQEIISQYRSGMIEFVQKELNIDSDNAKNYVTAAIAIRNLQRFCIALEEDADVTDLQRALTPTDGESKVYETLWNTIITNKGHLTYEEIANFFNADELSIFKLFWEINKPNGDDSSVSFSDIQIAIKDTILDDCSVYESLKTKPLKCGIWILSNLATNVEISALISSKKNMLDIDELGLLSCVYYIVNEKTPQDLQRFFSKLSDTQQKALTVQIELHDYQLLKELDNYDFFLRIQNNLYNDTDGRKKLLVLGNNKVIEFVLKDMLPISDDTIENAWPSLQKHYRSLIKNIIKKYIQGQIDKNELSEDDIKLLEKPWALNELFESTEDKEWLLDFNHPVIIHRVLMCVSQPGDKSTIPEAKLKQFKDVFNYLINKCRNSNNEPNAEFIATMKHILTLNDNELLNAVLIFSKCSKSITIKYEGRRANVAKSDELYLNENYRSRVVISLIDENITTPLLTYIFNNINEIKILMKGEFPATLCCALLQIERPIDDHRQVLMALNDGAKKRINVLFSHENENGISRWKVLAESNPQLAALMIDTLGLVSVSQLSIFIQNNSSSAIKVCAYLAEDKFLQAAFAEIGKNIESLYKNLDDALKKQLKDRLSQNNCKLLEGLIPEPTRYKEPFEATDAIITVIFPDKTDKDILMSNKNCRRRLVMMNNWDMLKKLSSECPVRVIKEQLLSAVFDTNSIDDKLVIEIIKLNRPLVTEAVADFVTPDVIKTMYSNYRDGREDAVKALFKLDKYKNNQERLSIVQMASLDNYSSSVLNLKTALKLLQSESGLSDDAAKALRLQAEFDDHTYNYYVKNPELAKLSMDRYHRFDNQLYCESTISDIKSLQSQYVNLVRESDDDDDIKNMRESGMLTIEFFIPANNASFFTGYIPDSPAVQIEKAQNQTSNSICG